ncbi:MAG: LysR family transcriptional regulator [Myxococcales bacterium]|nr:LysR family transcriptional regulator [Myxococcales bacterium]
MNGHDPTPFGEVALFVRVVEAGSFAAAARALGVPRSTLTRALSRLEDARRVRLLVRTPRAVSLTPAGRAFFDAVAPLIEGLREATETLGETQDQPRGTLKLTAPIDLGETHLARLLRAYAERYPQVRVELDLSSRVVDLVREGYDAAFRATRRNDPDLVARRLAEANIGYFAAPSYLAEHPAPQGPEDLAQHDTVLFLRGNEPEVWSLHGPRGAQREVRVGPGNGSGRCGRLGGNDYFFVRGLLREGAGIGPLPLSAGAVEVSAGKLVRVLPEWHGLGGTMYFVYPAGKHIPRRVTALRDMALEAFRDFDGPLKTAAR